MRDKTSERILWNLKEEPETQSDPHGGLAYTGHRGSLMLLNISLVLLPCLNL